jgi:CBS domain-containing protein
MEPNVQIVSESDDVEQAAKKMRESEIGFLPVCDSTGRNLVGTLTDRDITLRLVAEGKPPDTKVGEVMTTLPVFCHFDDNVDQARELMGKHQISRMIILDGNDEIAGVISLADIAGDPSSGETLKEIKAT